MSPNFPAFQLLLVLSFTLIVGLPLLIWLLMRGLRDRGAQLWFAAIAVNAAALGWVGYSGRFVAGAAVLFLGAVLLFMESMRWELGRRPTPWLWAGGVFGLYAGFQVALDTMGLRMSVGYIVNLFLLVVTDLMLIHLLYLVGRIHRSRGLWMVALGIGLVVVPNIFRLGQAVVEGGGPQVFAGSPATNVAVVVITLVSMLQVVGYGGFVMEKAHQRQMAKELAHARTLEQQRLAEAHTSELEAVVRQRDDMILLSSRFSAVKNLALYNSAIVHEISQPLQALSAILDGMSISAQGDNAQSQRIQHALAMVSKLSGTLDALRTLMGSRQPQLEDLSLERVLDELFPILRTQARRDQVLVQRVQHTEQAPVVRANRVLLQRVILNLVTNAFEALAIRSADRTEPKHLILATEVEQDQGQWHAVLRVEDNGPGWPEGMVLEPGLALRTTKDRGLGVGLSFTQMIVESWRGQLRVHDVPAERGPGAVAEVLLPLVGAKA